MKKKLSLILAVIMAILSIPMTATAAAETNEKQEGYYTYYVSESTAHITRVNGSIYGDVIIPDTLGGYPVTVIGGYDYGGDFRGAFQNCINITSINIPESVTEFGWYAFAGCTSLKSINIPDGVKYISYCAFANCTSLEDIAIPDSVKEIGWNAFAGCTSLDSINVSDNNTEYKSVDGVLFSKDGTELIQYPIGNTRSEYKIPNGVMLLGSFEGCTSLTSINIPDGVTCIGDRAFCGCTNLTSVTIPDGVTRIGWSAFKGCSSLTSVNIPDGVTSIDFEAFEGCTSLESVTIPVSVKDVGDMAFVGCISLTDIYYAGCKDEWNSISFADYYNDAYNYSSNIFYRILNSLLYVHYNVSSPENHYECKVIEEPGCDEDGKAVYVCSCGYSIDEVILAKGHTYENGVCIDCGKEILYGDVNSDEKINLADVTKLLQYIAKWELEDFDKDAADVNVDGKINLGDATMILKYIARWDGIVLGKAE